MEMPCKIIVCAKITIVIMMMIITADVTMTQIVVDVTEVVSKVTNIFPEDIWWEDKLCKN